MKNVEENKFNLPLTMMIRRLIDWRVACSNSYIHCDTRQEERYRLELRRTDNIHIQLLHLRDLGVQF